MSLDGMVAGPKAELDWAGAAMDDELWADVNELLGTVDGALFGRVTYRMFESYWPGVAGDSTKPENERNFSGWIRETPKVLASRSLKQLSWSNSTLLTNDVAEGVARMKRLPGKNLLLFGSPGLASQLFSAGLIDEFRIQLHPVVLGGRPLLEGVTVLHRLKLMRAKAFGSGVVGLRYCVA
jgi:dihydrofolate reductase